MTDGVDSLKRNVPLNRRETLEALANKSKLDPSVKTIRVKEEDRKHIMEAVENAWGEFGQPDSMNNKKLFRKAVEKAWGEFGQSDSIKLKVDSVINSLTKASNDKKPLLP